MPTMEIDLAIEFNALIDALEKAELPYAVVGGLAVAIWGAPRATTDIDILVLPGNVDVVVTVAKARGFSFEALPMTFGDGIELRRVTRLEQNSMLTLDLLLVNASLKPVWDSRIRVDTEAGPVWVVSREALIQMKAAAGRPQDLGDIERLTGLDR